MSEFQVGDRVRLLPTTPNLRLHNQVGDAVGKIIDEDYMKAWVVLFTLPDKLITGYVHEHEIEKVTDGD